jgi:hypothetical protein
MNSDVSRDVHTQLAQVEVASGIKKKGSVRNKKKPLGTKTFKKIHLF